jgi:membrane-bound lytic murein transglycosylase
MFDFTKPVQRIAYIPQFTPYTHAVSAIPHIPKLSIPLPTFHYQAPKVFTVPFDKKMCNDGRFLTMQQAFDFAAKHCLRFHGQITKPLIKAYLPLLQVYDQCEGVFTQASNIFRRDFESEYKRISTSFCK